MHAAQKDDGDNGVVDCDRQFKEFSIGECSVDACDTDRGTVWFTNISINEVDVSCKVDTGAQINILSKADFDRLKVKVAVNHTIDKLTGYTGHEIPVLGVVDLPFMFRGQTFRAEFYVTTARNHSLIGLPNIKRIGLLDVAQVERATCGTGMVVQFKDVFEGLGKLGF